MQTMTEVVAQKGEDKFALLDDVLLKAKFFEALDRKLAESGRQKENFSIAIKPNMMMFYSKNDMSVVTDPQLVEHLIARITERGFTRISVVESRNTYGVWFKNREVRNVARISGYSGNGYTIADLSEEAVAYDYRGRLGHYLVGRTWKDADFRISFAKNKTHFSCYFTLCIKNIYGTTPEENKFLEYHKKREIDWVTIEMLKHFPVHFGIIDATVGSDGIMGLKADYTPKYTKTILAGENIVAVDHVGAEKMGLDPMQSRFHRMAVKELGLPEITRVGDMSVYPDWDNLPPLVDEVADLEEEWYRLFNFVGFISAGMDPEFPPKWGNWFVLRIRLIFLRILKFISMHE